MASGFMAVLPEQQQGEIKLNKQSKYEDFVLMALFAAVILVLALTPVGYIRIGLISATLIHVPVIIGSVILGPKRGAVLGGIFGLTSFIMNFMTPGVLSFVFCPFIPVPGTSRGNPLAIVICFLPRILVGVVPYYVYRLMKKTAKNEYFPLLAGGAAGSLVNTLLVMGLIYLIFKNAYAAATGVDSNAVTAAIIGVVLMNGVPEAVAAALINAAVCKPLLRFREKNTVRGE